MTYSEVKKIIKELHSRGWYKVVGVSDYRRIYVLGKRKYGTLIDAKMLIDAKISISDFLDYHEREALKKLDEVNKPG